MSLETRKVVAVNRIKADQISFNRRKRTEYADGNQGAIHRMPRAVWQVMNFFLNRIRILAAGRIGYFKILFLNKGESGIPALTVKSLFRGYPLFHQVGRVGRLAITPASRSAREDDSL